METLKLYLRREPTTDSTNRAYLPPGVLAKTFDVQAYHDSACTQPAGRYVTGKPDRRNKYVVLNCYRYQAVWV